MLYTDFPSLDFHLDPADGRYAIAFSPSQPAYPLSSGRDTPYHPPSPSDTPASTPLRPAQNSQDVLFEGRTHLQYPLPDMHELKPGVLVSGQWTVNHPLVDAYLAALARLAPRQRPYQAPGASAPSTAATSPATTPQPLPDSYFPAPPSLLTSPPQNEAEKLRWRAHHGGIASVHTVAQVITVQYELFPGPGSAWYAAQVAGLSEEQKRAVFALAALKVLNHPTHPAHWALWAKNVLRRTAQVVEEIFQLSPCPIVSHVGWLGLPESIWALSGLQSTFIPPPPPQPEKPKAGGMTLRKRKVPAATSSSSVVVEEETAPLRVSPRKRQRTTRAQAALAQAQEEAAAAAVEAPSSAPSTSTSESTSGPVTPSESGSMLLDVPLPASVSKAVKQELVDIAGASAALQPLELSLAVPETAPAPRHDAVPSRVRSSASLSPNVARRSTRARRKPAPGPVTLSASPLSALSTPTATTSPAPLPAHEVEPRSSHGHAEQDEVQRARAGSCGSSTAVSEAGEASEGTVVVDLDGSELDTVQAKGAKRKAIEIEEARDTAPVEDSQDAVAPTTVAAKASKSKKSRSKAGGAARPKKRVKIDAASEPATIPPAAAVPDASGVENLPPAIAPAKKKAVSSKRKTTASRRA